MLIEKFMLIYKLFIYLMYNKLYNLIITLQYLKFYFKKL